MLRKPASSWRQVAWVPLGRRGAGVGSALLVRVPSPSSPFPLLPQQKPAAQHAGALPASGPLDGLSEGLG